MAKAGLRMTENTFQPIPLKPDFDIITEPRRGSWARGHTLHLDAERLGADMADVIRPDGLAQG